MKVERKHLVDGRDSNEQMCRVSRELEGCLRNLDTLDAVRLVIREVLPELWPIERTYCYRCKEPAGSEHLPACFFVEIAEKYGTRSEP